MTWTVGLQLVHQAKLYQAQTSQQAQARFAIVPSEPMRWNRDRYHIQRRRFNKSEDAIAKRKTMARLLLRKRLGFPG